MVNSVRRLRSTQTGGRSATQGTIAGRYALSVGDPKAPAPEDWEWTALSQVAHLESGHTPSRRVPEYWDGDIPWIGIKDATENHGRTIEDTYQHVTPAGIANSSARILPRGTVCLSRTASIGYVVVMGRPMATSQDFVNWVCSDLLDCQFLKYVLLGEQESFHRFASGTTHQTIYYPEAKAFHICLPPLDEQRAIASTLGTLDDKIELNRKMSATLEAMARAIFRSWFIDFDPVRAKAEGRRPEGMDEATAALFPDRFGEDGLPEGWRTATLKRYATLNPESWPRGGLPFEIRYVDLANTKWGEITAVQVLPGPEAPSRAQRILRFGDTIVGTVRPGNGSYSYIGEEGLTGSTGFAVLRPRHASYRAFTNLAATSSDNIERLAHLADGGAYPAVKPDLVLATEAPDVPAALIAAFSSLVDKLLDRIVLSQKASKTLEQVRDHLLPRLISGRLRVQDAKCAAEAAE